MENPKSTLLIIPLKMILVGYCGALTGFILNLIPPINPTGIYTVIGYCVGLTIILILSKKKKQFEVEYR